MSTAAIGIRILDESDGSELRRLAELDSAPIPAAPVLGATVDGGLVAAQSIRGGDAIADPFVPTAEVRALLADRVAQLRDGRRRSLSKRLTRRRRSRAALPASPPGAGGRLLEI